jgi:hypothetical protein
LLKKKPFGEEVVMSTPHAPHTPPLWAPRTSPLWRRVVSLPQTSLGWFAVAPTAVSVWVLVCVGLGVFELTPIPLLDLVFFGLAGAVLGLIAVLRSHERSWLVWLALVLGLGPAIIFLPYAIQYLLYVLNSPWYSP